ncbi:hypothetical protein MVEN_00591400 [Mycena venus]|uniref:Uncharacterized protein n=1 Tax=Mycena venus TaxID=2733690 RepID=A0A8H7D5R8_9AGAR|nr:hypothetical protein MVEN_00591400 [Mycena venus]
MPLNVFSRMRRPRATRITSDALAVTKVTLNAIQASTDAFPPLKSAVSIVIVVLDLSEKPKSNKKGCKHIAERSAQLVQDIWRQTKDFGVTLPTEVEKSVEEIEKLFQEITLFFKELIEENFWQRFALQDRHKSRIEEYGRLLDGAMLHFNMNLELSIHRSQVEFAEADRKRHTAVLAVSRKRHAAVLATSRMSESERLLLTQIRRDIHDLGDIHTGKHAAVLTAGVIFFFRTPSKHAFSTCGSII